MLHRRHAALSIVLALGVLIPTRSHAQSPKTIDTTRIRRIFSNEFAAQAAARTQWLDGDSYTEVDRGDIVRVDAGTGKRTVLVPSSQLSTKSGETLPVEGYTFSPDQRHVLIFTNSRRVWRQNTRRDYWVLDRTTSALHQLGGSNAKPSTSMFAKFSPTADRVAYVREGDLYVEPTDGGSPTRLTSDASRTVVNGTSDWLNEEEFGWRENSRLEKPRRSFARFLAVFVGAHRCASVTSST